MKTCGDYTIEAKRRLGNERMSDRELGELLGYSQQMIASGKHGAMSDPLAVKLAAVIERPAGELLMVARLEREKDPAIRAALLDWAGNVFSLMPSKAAPVELVRGGVRGGRTMRQNRLIMPTRQGLASTRPMVRSLHFSLAAMARVDRPAARSLAA